MPAPETPAAAAEPGTEALTPGPGSDFTAAMNAVLPRRRSPAWTLANCLTYGRLAAVPVMVALLFWPESHTARWTALGVFVAAAITDYLDGYVARTYHQSSALGRMLDPIADKLLVSACLLMLAADHTIVGSSVWAAIVIPVPRGAGLRPAGISRGAEGRRAGEQDRQVEDHRAARVARLPRAGPAGETVLPGTEPIGIALLWLAAALTIWTGWDYMRAGIKHVIDDPR